MDILFYSIFNAIFGFLALAMLMDEDEPLSMLASAFIVAFGCVFIFLAIYVKVRNLIQGR